MLRYQLSVIQLSLHDLTGSVPRTGGSATVLGSLRDLNNEGKGSLAAEALCNYSYKLLHYFWVCPGATYADVSATQPHASVLPSTLSRLQASTLHQHMSALAEFIELAKPMHFQWAMGSHIHIRMPQRCE